LPVVEHYIGAGRLLLDVRKGINGTVVGQMIISITRPGKFGLRLIVHVVLKI
jgi:hypothetical protein